MSIQSPLVVTAEQSTPFYRDTRIIAFLTQAVFVVALLLVGYFLVSNFQNSLASKGKTFSWSFLNQTAGFDISEGPTFLPTESYFRAFQIGMINTIRVALIGIVLALVLGLFVGLARLSNNWLLSTLAGIYIEVMRNTPLLVQLFFWYFSFILALPDIKNFAGAEGVAVISNRGIQLVWPFITATGSALRLWLAGGVVVGLLVSWWRRRQLRAQGKIGLGTLEGIVGFLVVALLGYFVAMSSASLPQNITFDLRRGDRGTLFVDANGNNDYDKDIDRPMAYVPVTLIAENGSTVLGTTQTDSQGSFVFFDLGEEKGKSITWEAPAPVVISRPVLQGFNIRGGLPIKPEYAGLLLGLVIYTAAFIAEIIRAGINAVSKGQWEASRALGLSFGQMVQMVVLPQAMRVAIPPLTSQFLNLTKNSSLALAVGYPDLVSVTQTIANQTGAEVQVILMLMATYLTFSLLTSAFTNWFNSRITLRER